MVLVLYCAFVALELGATWQTWIWSWIWVPNLDLDFCKKRGSSKFAGRRDAASCPTTTPQGAPPPHHAPLCARNDSKSVERPINQPQVSKQSPSKRGELYSAVVCRLDVEGN